ncbi:MAG: antibiotic biosynthesis monooxygenase family protein [Marinobacter sp.]
MSEIANTAAPPYYAVIFSNHRTEGDNGYAEVAGRMTELAQSQPGFLGMESVREDLEAQRLGHQKWYSTFRVRVAKVEREYGI